LSRERLRFEIVQLGFVIESDVHPPEIGMGSSILKAGNFSMIVVLPDMNMSPPLHSVPDPRSALLLSYPVVVEQDRFSGCSLDIAVNATLRIRLVSQHVIE
jgi:hypothetical protein